MKKIIFSMAVVSATILSCSKATYDNTITGEAIGSFTLVSPANSTNLVLNSATPAMPVTISWSAAKPGVNTAPTYTWIAALRTGSLSNPVLSLASGSAGTATSLTLTQTQIDAALGTAGIAAGATAQLKWSVLANNGTTTLMAADSFNINITRFGNGASPFVILGPLSSSTPVATDPGSTNDSLRFNWRRSVAGTGSPAVRYRVLFSVDGNFNAPLFSTASNSAGVDSIKSISFKDFSDSLNAKGLTNLSNAANLKWTVVATSGTWNQRADFANDIVVIREVRMFMPGGYQAANGEGTDWTPGNAPELVRDLRSGALNSIYYTYVSLPANAEFKITQGRSWDVNFGTATGTTGTAGSLSSGGSNFKVTSAGVYRISIDRTNMTYDVRLGRMGFVGGAVPGNNWTPANSFIDVNSTMGYLQRGLFIGINTFNTGGWKLIDNDNWNNGDVNITNNRSYGSTGNGSGDGSPLEINGANMPDIGTAGRYRVIWDGRNVNEIKYMMSPATEMRVVGNGMTGVPDWNPGASPQMTYTGNGIWTITLNLDGNEEIKFLAGNNWGAFDYEDAGSGATVLATPRKIKWDGGPNFKTPATAGSYTITLNEKTGTVTIN
jgi:starch-binding outer membrane protein SusE/F